LVSVKEYKINRLENHSTEIFIEGEFVSMSILNEEDQIGLIAHWLKTSKVENTEGSVNKEIIRYQLRMEFDIHDDDVVDKVYDAITE
jgi:hypothetical protein